MCQLVVEDDPECDWQVRVCVEGKAGGGVWVCECVYACVCVCMCVNVGVRSCM